MKLNRGGGKAKEDSFNPLIRIHNIVASSVEIRPSSAHFKIPFNHTFHLALILMFAICSYCSLPGCFYVLSGVFHIIQQRFFHFNIGRKVTVLSLKSSLCHRWTVLLWLLFKLIWKLKLLQLYNRTVRLI